MIRHGIALLGLLICTAALSAQQAVPPSADMQQLQEEIQHLTSSLQAMRSEVQACRDEIHSLRSELEVAKSAQQSGSASDVDVSHAVADLREDQSVTDSRVAT